MCASRYQKTYETNWGSRPGCWNLFGFLWSDLNGIWRNESWRLPGPSHLTQRTDAERNKTNNDSNKSSFGFLKVWHWMPEPWLFEFTTGIYAKFLTRNRILRYRFGNPNLKMAKICFLIFHNRVSSKQYFACKLSLGIWGNNEAICGVYTNVLLCSLSFP